MTNCSIYSQMFIYAVVVRIETVSYTKCTKSADTKHSKSAWMTSCVTSRQVKASHRWCVINYIIQQSVLKKMLQNCKNISTDGEVMSKIKVACFFLGHGVDLH